MSSNSFTSERTVLIKYLLALWSLKCSQKSTPVCFISACSSLGSSCSTAASVCAILRSKRYLMIFTSPKDLYSGCVKSLFIKSNTSFKAFGIKTLMVSAGGSLAYLFCSLDMNHFWLSTFLGGADKLLFLTLFSVYASLVMISMASIRASTFTVLIDSFILDQTTKFRTTKETQRDLSRYRHWLLWFYALHL